MKNILFLFLFIFLLSCNSEVNELDVELDKITSLENYLINRGYEVIKIDIDQISIKRSSLKSVEEFANDLQEFESISIEDEKLYVNFIQTAFEALSNNDANIQRAREQWCEGELFHSAGEYCSLITCVTIEDNGDIDIDLTVLCIPCTVCD